MRLYEQTYIVIIAFLDQILCSSLLYRPAIYPDPIKPEYKL